MQTEMRNKHAPQPCNPYRPNGPAQHREELLPKWSTNPLASLQCKTWRQGCRVNDSQRMSHSLFAIFTARTRKLRIPESTPSARMMKQGPACLAKQHRLIPSLRPSSANSSPCKSYLSSIWATCQQVHKGAQAMPTFISKAHIPRVAPQPQASTLGRALASPHQQKQETHRVGEGRQP